MSPRRLLVVTYYYPPDRSVGGHRWAAMVRYLRAEGHDVTILTTRMTGRLADDAEQQVVRAWDLQASPPVRRLLGRAPLEDAASGKGGGAVGTTPAPRWMTHGVVPDANLVAWVPAAARAARRIIRERQIDCVITSAPPDSVATVPLLLGRERPAWIADFRDGWRFEPLRGEWPTRVQARLDARVERRVTSTAEVVIGATRPIAEDFATRSGANSVHVPNAWDPGLDATVAATAPVPLDPQMFNLVHTGQLSGPRGRDPGPLFEAMRRIRDRDVPGADRLRLVLVGGLDAREEAELKRLDVREMVQVAGQQSHLCAVATQRAADALALLTSPGHRSQATGKLYEYLAAERPILELGVDNEAARIIVETQTGVAVPPRDVDAIAEALARLLSATSGYEPRRAALDAYRYPAPSDCVGDLVEDAIARRTHR
ncbi:MAG: glycosyltransferase [Solirubrobacteraceae bacterium]